MSKKKPLSLFTANKIFRLTKSISRKYKNGEPESSCCFPSSWVRGKFIYSNSIIERFEIETGCGGLSDEYGNIILDIVEQKYKSEK